MDLSGLVQAVHQTFYLVLEFNVQSQVDAEVADMVYVAEVTEPRNSYEPSRVRLANNEADHVA